MLHCPRRRRDVDLSRRAGRSPRVGIRPGLAPLVRESSRYLPRRRRGYDADIPWWRIRATGSPVDRERSESEGRLIKTAANAPHAVLPFFAPLRPKSRRAASRARTATAAATAARPPAAAARNLGPSGTPSASSAAASRGYLRAAVPRNGRETAASPRRRCSPWNVHPAAVPRPCRWNSHVGGRAPSLHGMSARRPAAAPRPVGGIATWMNEPPRRFDARLDTSDARNASRAAAATSRRAAAPSRRAAPRASPRGGRGGRAGDRSRRPR